MKVCKSCSQFRILDDDDSDLCNRCGGGETALQKTPQELVITHDYAVRKTDKEYQLVLRLRELRAQKWSLRKIAEVEFGGRVSHAMIARCLAGNLPKRTKNRVALGLPITAPAPVCLLHGIVHTKRCQGNRATRTLSDYRDLFAAPVGVLRAALEGREEI